MRRVYLTVQKRQNNVDPRYLPVVSFIAHCWKRLLSNMNGLFRAWKPSPKGQDPVIQRLEKEAEETRQKIAQLREQGRQRRAHRLQSLDALETRRMTLIEILKRMDKELQTKDVNDYADTLAEVFGERKIFAHRAIGLEALLCQFMHQMLAKQHQLKIMKRTGKALYKFYQMHKTQNREEFHSFEALAVHLETMRLSLEAQYDDIFAAQHSLLARLNHVEAGGTMTNYKIVKSVDNEKPKMKPTMTISQKYLATIQTPKTPSHYNSGGLEEDDVLMKHVLTGDDDISSIPTDSLQNIDLDDSKSIPTSPRRPTSRLSDAGSKSARDRRREIEQRRLASGRKGIRNDGLEDPDKERARERLRQLEAKRASLNDSGVHERYSAKSKSRKDFNNHNTTNNSVSSGGSLGEDAEARASPQLENRKSDRAGIRAIASANS